MRGQESKNQDLLFFEEGLKAAEEKENIKDDFIKLVRSIKGYKLDIETMKEILRSKIGVMDNYKFFEGKSLTPVNMARFRSYKFSKDSNGRYVGGQNET